MERESGGGTEEGKKCCLGRGAVRLSGPGTCSHHQVQEGEIEVGGKKKKT